MRRLLGSLGPSLFGAIVAAACGLVLLEYSFGSRLVRMSYDLLLAARGDLPADGAVLVYMDELSHEKLNQKKNAPFDRSLHARLIDRLTQAGASAIVFDIVFSDPDAYPERDQALIEAVKRSGRVVLAADNVVKVSGSKTKEAVPPFPLLLDTGVPIGSSEVVADLDMVVREHTAEDQIPSLSWAAAEFVQAPATRTEKVGHATHWINYYGSPGSLPWTSYYRALERLTPDSFFSNKVVFVGARLMTRFAGERKDEFSNPFSLYLPREERFIAGAEIQATAFLNLVRGDWLRRWSLQKEVWIVVLLGIGMGVLFSQRLHPMLSMAVGLGAVVAVFGISVLLFRSKLIWFPWLVVETQVAATLTWSVTFNAMRLYVQKRLFEHTISLYLSPKLVKKFASSPQMLKPGAEKNVLTLFFSDIEGFTSISEGMDSDVLAKMMNNYFQSSVKQCIHRTDGTVVKYIGDAIFAFWNAPEPQKDHAYRACCAALYMQGQQTLTPDGKPLRTRIGLHTGVANVGNFGSEDRVDYTALGESVNFASRLEGLNKYVGTSCLISGTTAAEIGEQLITRSLGRFQLKGFETPVEIHELVGFPEQAEETRKWRETFANALQNFEQGNIEFAAMGFRQVLKLHPGDGPSQFYLGKIDEASRQTMPDQWSTYTILKEK